MNMGDKQEMDIMRGRKGLGYFGYGSQTGGVSGSVKSLMFKIPNFLPADGCHLLLVDPSTSARNCSRAIVSVLPVA